MSVTPVIEKPKKKTPKAKAIAAIIDSAKSVDVSEFANRSFPDPLGRTWEQVLIDRDRILSNSRPADPVPGGGNAIAYIMGKWPGDETDEEIEEALKWIS